MSELRRWFHKIFLQLKGSQSQKNFIHQITKRSKILFNNDKRIEIHIPALPNHSDFLSTLHKIFPLENLEEKSTDEFIILNLDTNLTLRISLSSEEWFYSESLISYIRGQVRRPYKYHVKFSLCFKDNKVANNNIIENQKTLHDVSRYLYYQLASYFS